MPKIVKQSVTLPASARTLYDMYLSPGGHRRITGMKATSARRRARRSVRSTASSPARSCTPCRGG